MISANVLMKEPELKEHRLALKRIVKICRHYCLQEDHEKIELRFDFEHPTIWWTDKWMNSHEWRAITIWEVELGFRKLEDVDQEETSIDWYFRLKKEGKI